MACLRQDRISFWELAHFGERPFRASGPFRKHEEHFGKACVSRQIRACSAASSIATGECCTPLDTCASS
eukprot:4668899-Pleurochrysis_carterae.AAC.1